MEVEKYASKGVAGAGLGLGIAGTALGLLNGNAGNLLDGLLGGKHGDVATAMLAAAVMNNTGCHHACGENEPVNRYELGLQQQLSAEKSENALLKSNIYTDQKLVEVYAALQGQIKELAGEVRANKDAQCAINTEQAVYNGTNTATINCLRGQVFDLLNLTKRVVPNTSICPGWGDVTVSVTPAAAGTAAGA